MNKNLLAIICSNSKKKPYSVKSNQIGVTRNAVAINPLTGYNVSTGNVMTQVANSSVSNLVVNGLTGWTAQYGVTNITFSDNTLYSTGDGTNISPSIGYTTTSSIITGNKIYCRALLKVANSVCTSIDLLVRGSTGGTAQTISTKSSPTQDTWYTLSGVVALSGQTGNIRTQIRENYVDVSTANGKTLQAQSILTVDLTATFGAGFEPTQAWCDANIPFFTGTLSNPSWINPLVTHGQYAYVGGENTELTFDFGTKTSGNVSECPMKIYRTIATSLQPYTNITTDVTTGFMEITDQVRLDKLKTIDSNSDSVNSSGGIANQISQYLVELDLSPVCNQLFGGSNSALESAIKTLGLTFDVYASGGGNNGGVSTNGVKMTMWDFNSGNNWGETLGWWVTENTTASVTRMSFSPTSFVSAINSSNKVYLLIHASYPSSATIPSFVNLDYLKVTLNLTRTADIVAPKNITIPSYWAMLVKGFSPSWDNTSNPNETRVVELYKDSINRYLLSWSATSFSFFSIVNNVLVSGTRTVTFSKNQITNLLLECLNGTLKLRVLKNNDTVVSNQITTSSNYSGPMSLRTLISQDSGGSKQANAFFESLHICDLRSLGKITYGNELVTNGDFSNGANGWYIGTTGGVVNNKMVINNSVSWGIVDQYFSCLPNTTYKLSVGENTGFVGIDLFQDSTKITQDIVNTTLSETKTFTTGSNINRIRVKLSNGATVNADCIIDNVSVKQVTTNGFTDYEAESILRSDSKYYQTTTSDFTGKISGSVVENPNLMKELGNSILVQPSSFSVEGTQNSYNYMKVLNDGSVKQTTTNTSTFMPQQLIAHNVIEIVKRKYFGGGPIPGCSTTAEEVAWLKSNINNLTIKWYGYGSCSTGNKAYIDYWDVDNNRWAFNYGGQKESYKNTTSTPTVTTIGTALITNKIDPNGFYNMLAYTDAARTTDSTLVYITAHGLTINDVIENTTRNSAGYVVSTSVTNDTLPLASAITGQTGGDSIDKFRCTSTNKYMETGTTSTVIKITGHGLSNTHAHYIKNATRGYACAKVTVTDANTLTIVGGVVNTNSSITGQTTGDNVFIYTYAGTQTALSTAYTSNIFTDYVSLDVTVKTGVTSIYVADKELFDINQVSLHANASRNNGVITLNATSIYQFSSLKIPVLPNNKYSFTATGTATGGTIDIAIFGLVNNINTGYLTGVGVGTNTITFTTPNNCNYVLVKLQNASSTGTFTYRDISLKLKM